MPLLTSRQNLLLTDFGELALSSSCCCDPPPPKPPSPCCTNINISAPFPLLEIELLNFTSSRGNFTDFDIAGPHLVPSKFPNPVGGQCGVWELLDYQVNQSMWESAFEGPLAQINFSNVLTGTCGIVAAPAVQFDPFRVVLPPTPADGSPWVNTKQIGLANGFLSLMFQSRTANFPNQLCRFTSDSISHLSILSSAEFLRRACLGTLDITIFARSALGFRWTQISSDFGQCRNNSFGGEFSFDVRIRSSNLP